MIKESRLAIETNGIFITLTVVSSLGKLMLGGGECHDYEKRILLASLFEA